MFWCGRFFGAVDILVQSMFWCGLCFGAVDILVQYVLVRSMFWCGSMFWCSQCFGAVDVLDWSKFCAVDEGRRPEKLFLYFRNSIKSV